MRNFANGLPAIHPGEFLRETLADLALTQAATEMKDSLLAVRALAAA